MSYSVVVDTLSSGLVWPDVQIICPDKGAATEFVMGFICDILYVKLPKRSLTWRETDKKSDGSLTYEMRENNETIIKVHVTAEK